jgi:hypothetical protein
MSKQSQATVATVALVTVASLITITAQQQAKVAGIPLWAVGLLGAGLVFAAPRVIGSK